MLQYTYEPLELFNRCQRRYGDTFTLKLPGFGAFVMASSPELIKAIFTGDSEVLHAGKGNEMLEPIVGRNSVLLLDGKEHLRQRRLLMPPLHGERMQAYAELMAEIATKTAARMPVGERFAIHPFMQEVTLQVILRAVFGLTEGAQMSDLAAVLNEYMTPPPAAMIFVPPKMLPYLDLPLSPYRAFLRRRGKVDRALREIIRARQASDNRERTDILSMLLEARDEEGRGMTEDELRDELMTMLIAGHETTATALSWTFGFLLGHPEVSERLQAEVDGACDEQGLPDAAALASSEFLDAVIKESLRLRPIVPDVVRYVRSPTQFAGHEIPVGAFLSPCIHLAHRRAESWPDPDRFNPQRFVGAKVDPYAWLPFGGGIRRCLGMAFALYEMKIVLGVILQRARMRLATKDPLKIVRRGVTLAPAGGMPVVVEERRAPQRRRTAATVAN
jgi:cytochrome P450